MKGLRVRTVVYAAIGIIALLLAGCSAGVRDLGSHTFANGSIVRYIQATTEGHDKPQLTAVQAFVETPDGRIHKLSEWAIGGMSIAGELAKQVISSGGDVGAAYLFGASIRPDKHNNTSSLNNVQGQGQVQRQAQSSSNSNTNSNNNNNNSSSSSSGDGEGGSHPGCENSGHC